MNPIEAIKKIICANEIYAMQQAKEELQSKERIISELHTDLLKQNIEIGTIISERNKAVQEKVLLQAALADANLDENEIKLADFIDSKYPAKNDVRYICRYVYVVGAKKSQQIQSCDIDPRMFFQKDSAVREIANTIQVKRVAENKDANDWDYLAYEAERWVKKNIKYVSDKSVFDLEEYWQFPYETLKLRTADCEDGAILLANLLIELGVPSHRVRLNAGNVSLGGHAYVTYCRKTDNQFVVLDWCFETTSAAIQFRETHRTMRDYWTVWFSWTKENIYSGTPKEKWL